MNRERASAVVFSLFLVVSAMTVAIPASAFTPDGPAHELGVTAGNDATTETTTLTETTTTETTTTAGNDEPTTVTETTTESTTTTEPREQPGAPKEKSNPKVSSSLLDRIDSAENGPTTDGTGGTEFVQVVVRASPGRSDEVAGLVGTNDGDVQVRHENLVQARVPEAAVQALADSGAVEFVREPRKPVATDVTSEGLSNMDVETVHDANYTGDNVTVAVVDLGFDVTNPEIADQVVNWRNFSSPDSPRTMANESGLHGTGTAELVADTAPNASIIAVKVNYPLELYEAIDWIENNTSADVVSMSVGWYNVGPLDGSAEMNQQIRTSVDSGTPWVISAGNEANGGHWGGTWSNPDGDDYMNFEGSDERMNVTPAGGSGTVSIAVSWNDWSTGNEDYDAVLVNESGVVEYSGNVQNGTQEPTEYIYEYVDEPVYLKLRNYHANESADFNVFFRGSADPEYTSNTGSITIPATGPRVITVGAVHYSDNELEGFSSRGPTVDGRTKPDVVAPDGVTSSAYPNGFYGTSAATPHTAGVAALMLDADGTLAPAEVKSRLRSSAVPLRGTEPNNRTGYGLVDADSAIPSVEETSPDEERGVVVTGHVDDADGNPSADDLLYFDSQASDDTQFVYSNATGDFSATGITAGEPYDVGYYQDWSASTDFPQDGTADLYALDRVNATNNTDIGDLAVPNASVLNVRVVSESGDPVPDADVTVSHFRPEASTGLGNVAVDSQGWIAPGEGRGIEVTGDVVVRVRRPSGDESYVDRTYTRDLTVQNDTSITVTLEETISISGQVDDANGNPSSDDFLYLYTESGDSIASAYTNATGNFSATGLAAGKPHVVNYYQNSRSNVTTFPRDGTPDLYVLDEVNATEDVDLGHLDLPNASLLNVRVEDESGDPVENATVNVTHHRLNRTAGWANVLTDAGGYMRPYEKRGIEVLGDISLEVRPPENSTGFVGQVYMKDINVTSDEEVTVTLTEEKVNFTAQINEPNGTPASGDTVGFKELPSTPGPRGFTNATGEFTVEVYDESRYQLEYYQDDRSDDADLAFPNDGSPDLYALGIYNTSETRSDSTTLPEAHDLNVTVETVAGDPIENAEVVFRHYGDGEAIAMHGISTNADGMAEPEGSDGPGFELTGGVDVIVKGPDGTDYRTNKTSLTVDTATDLRIVLRKPIDISGSITEADGDTPVDDTVFLPSEPTGTPQGFSMTDASGNFSTSLEQTTDPYDVQYYQGNFSRQDRASFLPNDGSPDMYAIDRVSGTSSTDLGDLTLPDAHVVNVTVVDENGVPVENALVNASHYNDGADAGMSNFTTDADGRLYTSTDPANRSFGFELVGNVTLEVAPPENSTVYEDRTHTRDLNVTSDEEVTVTLTRETVNFSAEITEHDGTAASGDTVNFKELSSLPNTRGYTNSTGEFTVELYNESRYQLEYYQDDRRDAADLAFPDDGSPDLYALGIYDAAETQNVTKTLPEAHDLNVTVETVSGDPVENATVKIRHYGEGDALAMHGVSTNADGMMEPEGSDGPGFEVTGEIDVIVQGPDGTDYLTNRTSLSVGSDRNITMVLREPIEVSGRVVKPNGDPAVDDLVWVPAGGVQGQGFVNTDADGNFSATAPEGTGRYDVQYYQANFSSHDETFMPRDGSPDVYAVTEVDAGNSTDLGTVELPDAYVLNVTVVDESDVPVENASVNVSHANEGATSGLGSVYTDAEGRMNMSAPNPPGIEVVGNVSVGVEPPENATIYRNETQVTNLTVSGDTEVTVTLDEKDLTAPEITSFRVNATDQRVEVRFDASEQLENVTVELGGDATGTLTAADFSVTNDGGTYQYRANASDGRDGTFHATLLEAEDAAGNDGAASQTDSATVDVEGPSVNATVTDATDGDGLVTDGDEVRIEAVVVENGTSVTGVTANVTHLNESLGNVSLAHVDGDTYETTIETHLPDEDEQTVVVTASDESDNANSDADSINVDASPPSISNFSVSSVTNSESTLLIKFRADEKLETLELKVTDSDGNVTHTFNESNVGEDDKSLYYEYTVSDDVSSDDTYHATLVDASDVAGNEGVTGETTDSTVVDTTAPTISNLSATTDSGTVTVAFEADERLNTSAVVAEVTDDSGTSVTNLSSFQNESGTGTLYRDEYTASEGVNETWTVTLTKAEDDHGNDGADGQSDATFVDTQAPTVTNFDATFEDGTITVTVEADEPLAADETIAKIENDNGQLTQETPFSHVSDETYKTTYEVDPGSEGNYTVELAEVADEAGNTIWPQTRQKVWVDTAAPNVTTFDLRADGQDVDLYVEAHEELSNLSVALDGSATSDLTLADFDETQTGGGYVYIADVSNGSDGTFEAALVNATDTHENANTTDLNDSVVVDTRGPAVDDFGFTTDGQDVNLTFTSNESLTEIAVNLTGDAGGDLARSDFTETKEEGRYTYTADVSEDTDGTFTAELTHVEDEHGNAPDVAGLATITVDTKAPDVSNLSATTPDGSQTIQVTFDADESLDVVSVAIAGPENATLAAADFDEDGETYAATYNTSDDGEYAVSLETAADGHGNDGADGQNDSVTVDSTAPKVSVHEITDADDNEVVADGENVSVAINVSDELTEVESVTADASELGAGTVTLSDSDDDGTFRGNFTVDATGLSDGDRWVYVTAVDVRGNDDSETRAQEFLLDAHAPNTSARLSGDKGNNDWYTSEVEVNLTASDDTDSVARTDYRIDDGDWRTYDGNFTVSTDGKRTVTYRSVDEAGNVEENRTAEFRIDTTDPMTRFDTNASANYAGWYASDVNVTLSAIDWHSGVNAIYYRVDDAENWTKYDDSEGIQLTTDGEHTVEFYSVDDAGNREENHSETVRIDTKKPTVDDTRLPNKTEILPEHAIPVVVNATDDNGVATILVDGVRVGQDGNGFVPAAPALGDHSFKVVVEDVAGNENVVWTANYSVGEKVKMNPTEEGTLAAETNDTNVGEVAIETRNETSEADVTVGTAETNPEPDRGDPDPEGTSLYFPQIDASVSNDDIENASVTVTVEQSRVRQKYVRPGTVQFWVEEENEDTGWEKVNAERVDDTDDDGTYTYEIEAPHFSTYAITGETESAPPNASLDVASDSPTVGNVTITGSFADGYSGVDPANVTLEFDGEDVTGDAEVSAGTVTYTRNLSAGEYEATLRVTDNAGNSLDEPETVSFAVVNESDGGEDGGGGGGGGGGDVPPPSVQVSIEDLTGSSLRAKITSARAGSPGVVSPDDGIGAGDVTLRRLTVTPESSDAESRFFVDAQVATETPAAGASPAETTLGYLDLSTTYISDSELAELAPRFAVSASAADAPEDVAVYVLRGGQWERVETTVIGEDGGQYVVEASASDAGTFAVGVLDSDDPDDGGTTDDEPDETTTTTAPGDGPDDGTTTGTDDGDDNDGGIPGFGMGAALVALLAGLLVARRLR